MFWDNKQKKIDERIAEILNVFYKYGSDINDQIYRETSKKSILIILEIYAFFHSLADYFIVINDVEEKHRKMFFEYTWSVLKYSNKWTELHLSESELRDFVNNRIDNYANILIEYKGINSNYFQKIIEYQTQLLANIIEKNKLSYYNPLPKELWEYSDINTDSLLNYALNSILTNFIIKGVSLVIKGLEKNFINDFFNNINFTPRL